MNSSSRLTTGASVWRSQTLCSCAVASGSRAQSASAGSRIDAIFLRFGDLQQREAAHGAAQAPRAVEHVDARLRDLLAARDAVARFAGRAVVRQREHARLDPRADRVRRIAQEQLERHEPLRAERVQHGVAKLARQVAQHGDGFLAAEPLEQQRGVGRRLPLDAARGVGRQHVADDGCGRRDVDGVQHGVRLLDGHRLEQARRALGVQAQDTRRRAPRGRSRRLPDLHERLVAEVLRPAPRRRRLGLDEHAAVGDLDDAPLERADLARSRRARNACARSARR